MTKVERPAVVVAADPESREALARALEDYPGPVHCEADVQEGRAKWAAEPCRALFVHLHGPDDGGGFEFIDLAREREEAAIVVVAPKAAVDLSRAILDRPGVHLLHTPLDEKRALHLATAGVPSRRTGDAHHDEDRIMESLGSLLGRSEPMQTLFRRLARAAPSSATVLVTGESGTGKELVGRTLHELSERRRGPYVTVNCGAISPTLMESELFGHEKGSFTGAMRQHRGFFERADHGTLFLDEITEMALELQVKLLRVLETSHFTRIGGEVSRNADVRIAAATNRRLENAVGGGKLREDLLYRLKVIHLDIPPLRERLEDIDLLAPHIVSGVSLREGVPKTLPERTLRALHEYDWPGNVRELQNALYTAYLLSEETEVEVEALPPDVRPRGETEAAGGTVPIRVGSSIKDAERTMILTTLAEMEGNKTRTAEALGISLKTLYNRLHTYGYMEREEGL